MLTCARVHPTQPELPLVVCGVCVYEFYIDLSIRLSMTAHVSLVPRNNKREPSPHPSSPLQARVKGLTFGTKIRVLLLRRHRFAERFRNPIHRS